MKMDNVDGLNKWLIILIELPIFDWYVVQRGSKIKHHKDACLKEIGLHLQIQKTILHTIVSAIGGTYISILVNNKYALLINITKSREVRS